MKMVPAAALSALWFALAPGVVAGLVPWWLTRWTVQPAPSYWLPFRIVGAALIAAGAFVIVGAFIRFVREGLGTPLPLAPPERLVVRGTYRHVRNPMYVAVMAAIVGQALALAHAGLVGYAAVVMAVVHAFVRLYEEPALHQRFGEQYDAYRRAVPRWWPRLRPWDSTK